MRILKYSAFIFLILKNFLILWTEFLFCENKICFYLFENIRVGLLKILSLYTVLFHPRGFYLSFCCGFCLLCVLRYLVTLSCLFLLKNGAPKAVRTLCLWVSLEGSQAGPVFGKCTPIPASLDIFSWAGKILSREESSYFLPECLLSSLQPVRRESWRILVFTI